MGLIWVPAAKAAATIAGGSNLKKQARAGRRSYQSYALPQRFSLLHPGVMMLFFVAVLVVTLISYHPLLLLLSLVLAAAGVALYLGSRSLLQTFAWLIPSAVIVVGFNVLFNRRGATELATLQFFGSSFTFTQESLFFGASIALMLAAIMLWFRLYQHFMTSDRFLYLAAPVMPTTALATAMVQRWIPLTKYRWQQIRRAQKSLQIDSGKRRRDQYRALTQSLSALMSWSMEDAIEAADSMQARGYRSKKEHRRTSFRAYRFTSTDAAATALIATLFAIATVTIFATTRDLAFFPVFRGADLLSPVGLAATLALMAFPLLIEGKEKLTWSLRTRIHSQ